MVRHLCLVVDERLYRCREPRACRQIHRVKNRQLHSNINSFPSPQVILITADTDINPYLMNYISLAVHEYRSWCIILYSDGSGIERKLVVNFLPIQGSHSFTDKKNPGLFQDFPGPHEKFSWTFSEPANV